MTIYPPLKDRTAKDLKELIALARQQLELTRRWEKTLNSPQHRAREARLRAERTTQ